MGALHRGVGHARGFPGLRVCRKGRRHVDRLSDEHTMAAKTTAETISLEFPGNPRRTLSLTQHDGETSLTGPTTKYRACTCSSEITSPTLSISLPLLLSPTMSPSCPSASTLYRASVGSGLAPWLTITSWGLQHSSTAVTLTISIWDGR